MDNITYGKYKSCVGSFLDIQNFGYLDIQRLDRNVSLKKES